jgi:hypothetical protein
MHIPKIIRVTLFESPENTVDILQQPKIPIARQERTDVTARGIISVR